MVYWYLKVREARSRKGSEKPDVDGYNFTR